MTRSVVILGFPGVQPLDLVGPHDVFAKRRAAHRGRLHRQRGRPDGGPITTPTGLGFVAQPTPDPDTIDPGAARRRGVDAVREDPATMAWIRARRPPPAASSASAPAHSWPPGRPARRPPRHHTLGLRRPAGAGVPGRHRRPRADLRAQCADGVDRRGRHRRTSTLRCPGRGGLRHRVAQTVARWLVLYLRRPGGQTSSPRRCGCRAPAATDPRGAGVHRGRTRCPAASRTWPAGRR